MVQGDSSVDKTSAEKQTDLSHDENFGEISSNNEDINRRGVEANANLVIKHYDDLRKIRLQNGPRNDAIKNLVNFSNGIKTFLIEDAVRRRKAEGKEMLVVHDMCCGTGRDMHKWIETKAVEHIVFSDISPKSMEECRQRYLRTKSEENPNDGTEDGKYGCKKENGSIFTAQFIQADCTKEILKEKYEDKNIKFDIVSIQFAFHYCFESLEQTKTMLSNISDNLAPGGFFLGTTTNDVRIIQSMKQAGKKEFGNEVFNIKFLCEEPFPLFGAKVNIQIKTGVNCPEFLVNFSELVRLAKEYGLELVYKLNFDDFFQGDRPFKGHGPQAQENFWNLSKHERECLLLFIMFVFEKM